MKHIDVTVNIKTCREKHNEPLRIINGILVETSLLLLWFILWFDIIFRLVPK